MTNFSANRIVNETPPDAPNAEELAGQLFYVHRRTVAEFRASNPGVSQILISDAQKLFAEKLVQEFVAAIAATAPPAVG